MGVRSIPDDSSSQSYSENSTLNYYEYDEAIHREIREVQSGFLLDGGTRNAIFIFRMICERFIEVQTTIYCCFLHHEKALGNVQYSILFEITIQTSAIQI